MSLGGVITSFETFLVLLAQSDAVLVHMALLGSGGYLHKIGHVENYTDIQTDRLSVAIELPVLLWHHSVLSYVTNQKNEKII